MKEIIINKPDKNIPVNTVIEKKKILFHDTKKVLLFERTRRNNTVLLVPTFMEGQDFRENVSFMQQFIDDENLEKIYQVVSYSKFFECKNCSLIPFYEQQVRNYFSCYHEFTDEEIHMILTHCFQERIKAHMLTFEEIRNLKLGRRFQFDQINIEICNELESEIKKYVKR